MQVFRSIDAFEADLGRNSLQGKSIVTVGNFDGVHKGHRLILNGVVENALARRCRSLAVTFEPHPSQFLHPEQPPRLITPLDKKLQLLAEAGIDATLVLPFTKHLSEQSPFYFVRVFLELTFRAREVHEGTTFRFGHRGEGTVEYLIEQGRADGSFDVFAYSPLIVRGAAVSSSRIRTLIAAGNVSQARALLDRPFSIDSTPAPGRGYGTRYTVPTINLAPYADLLPANGVYITTLTVGTGASAEMFEAVTNVGNRPTFGADSFAVESHLLNFHPIELEEQTPLRLTFLRRLRAEQRFPSPEALRDQITHDVTQARRYFTLCHALA